MIIYVQSLEGVEVICEFWIVSLDHRDVSFSMYVIVARAKLHFLSLISDILFSSLIKKKKRERKMKKEKITKFWFSIIWICNFFLNARFVSFQEEEI